MKVTTSYSQILKSTSPDVLQAHLQATGWHETGRIYNDAGAIWRLKKDAARVRCFNCTRVRQKSMEQIRYPLNKSG
jgi:hypothetical protein